MACSETRMGCKQTIPPTRQPAFKVDELDMICEALGVSFEELLTIPVDMHEKFFGAETPDLEVTA